MTDGRKRMSIREFRELGFLQEANRLFFHPRGLALEVKTGDNGDDVLSGVWDCRDDPEGVTFADGPSVAKAMEVDAEYQRHAAARFRLFRDAIQPTAVGLPNRSDDESTAAARVTRSCDLNEVHDAHDYEAAPAYLKGAIGRFHCPGRVMMPGNGYNTFPGLEASVHPMEELMSTPSPFDPPAVDAGTDAFYNPGDLYDLLPKDVREKLFADLRKMAEARQVSLKLPLTDKQQSESYRIAVQAAYGLGFKTGYEAAAEASAPSASPGPSVETYNALVDQYNGLCSYREAMEGLPQRTLRRFPHWGEGS